MAAFKEVPPQSQHMSRKSQAGECILDSRNVQALDIRHSAVHERLFQKPVFLIEIVFVHGRLFPARPINVSGDIVRCHILCPAASRTATTLSNPERPCNKGMARQRFAFVCSNQLDYWFDFSVLSVFYWVVFSI
jgi:hypothetical protein